MKKNIFLLLFIALFIIGFNAPLSSVQAKKSLPKITKVKILKKYPKKIRLQWKKTNKAKYYQIRVVKKRNNKYKLVKKVKTKKNVRRQYIKKLSPAKTYYFRIRACRTKNNCGLYSKRVRGKTKTENTNEEEVNDDDSENGDNDNDESEEETDEDGEEEEEQEEENSLVIKNLIVDFADWDPVTDTAGAFIFNASLDKVFIEFLGTVDGDKVLPTFEYILDEDANVYSPIDGVVNSIEYQEGSEDYEIHINPTSDPYQMTAGLDHVLNVVVSEGQTVTAGDIIGNPGTYSLDGYGRVEIEIYGDNYMHCPFEFFDSTLQAEYEQKVTQLMQDWETFKSDTSLYDQATMADYAAGCLAWQYSD